jgi:hypothetical protein
MAITNGIIDLEQGKKAIGSGFDNSDVEDLEAYIEALTPCIEELCGPVVPRSVVEIASGGDTALDLNGRVASVTSITTRAGTMTADADYYLVDGVIYGGQLFSERPFPWGERNIRVEYVTGFSDMPPNIILAASELVAHWWRTSRVSGRTNRFGGAEGDLVTPSGFGVPYRVIDHLRPNLRLGGIA